MDRVGSGAWGNGAGNMAVGDGIENGIGTWGSNDKVPVDEGGGRLDGAKTC